MTTPRISLLHSLALTTLVTVTATAGDVTNQRLAWAHYTPWHTPLNSSISAYSYYNYPIFRSAGTDKADYAEEFRQAKAQGIDGFFVDVVFKNQGHPAFDDATRKMLQAAEGSDFQIGLCLDVKTSVEIQVRELSRMLSDYGSHPNYPRHEGRPVIATYTWGKWTPQEWADIRAGLQSAGHEVYLIANVDPNYGSLTREWLDSYAPEFDMAYTFSLAGLNGMPRQKMADLIADSALTHQKSYMATLYPGYYGAWLNGRNDFYQPHRGFDQLHDTFLAMRKERDQGIQFTTWNDHDETSVLPMLFTSANPRITKAYTDAFKQIPPTSTRPDISLAYHREEIPGTLLRIEALSLPTLVNKTAVVSGQLLDQTGKALATLEPKELSTGRFDRTEWLIPTADLAYSPTLTPKVTVTSRDFTHTASLPPILLINGWQQNTVTVKVPLNNRIEFKNTLSIIPNKNHPGLLTVDVSFDLDSDTTTPENAGQEITGITLFRNDRPLAALNSKTEGKTLLNLFVSGTADWTLRVENGEVLNAVRKFTERNSPAFSWQADEVKSSRVQGWFPAGIVCAIQPDTRFILSERGADPVTLTAQELASRGHIEFKKTTIEASPVDTTAQTHVAVAEKGGSHQISVLTQQPHVSDMFYIRYETKGGQVALSRIVYPFAKPGETIPANLVQTSINLETSSGASGLRGENEYLTDRKSIPLAKPTVTTSRIPPESIRAGRWTFDNGGEDSLGDMPVRIPSEMLVPDEESSGNVLHLDGTKPLKMRLRTWPIGNATIDFRLKPSVGASKPQSIIGRSGWSDAVNISLLPDGRIEVVRDGGENVLKETLVSEASISPETWTRLRVTNDSRALRLYINGELDSTSAITPARSYGNSTWFVGGGYEAGIKSGYENFRGAIDDLTVYGAAFAPGEARAPSDSIR